VNLGDGFPLKKLVGGKNMASKEDSAIFEISSPDSFGPAKQSIEIKNTSKKNLTVQVENSGSEYFVIPYDSGKLRIKPGRSSRVQIKFKPPEKGFVYSLKANYRGVIKVWELKGTKTKQKELLDIIVLNGTAPGIVTYDKFKCFEGTGKSAKRKPKRKLKGRRAE